LLEVRDRALGNTFKKRSDDSGGAVALVVVDAVEDADADVDSNVDAEDDEDDAEGTGLSLSAERDIKHYLLL
jgi:hypothetical protein